ncbi:glycosyl transferase family 1 [Paludibacterium purpuratum]|uniref:Glycosyl transferase family 1 n=2 Tax=Paludibacterium purpuratum TaxID=1144873 RepID=A0A4R7B1X8_9NEIS|nr:glycosyl transferase family 1 [Paludibacterium purpuratum]
MTKKPFHFDFWNKLNAFGEAKLARHYMKEAAQYFSPALCGSFNPSSHSAVQEADIVALYWINGGFIKPSFLRQLDKPIVWRLSDTWPFTGGCHYPSACKGFTQECGNCPQIKQPAPTDISFRLLEKKQSLWHDLNITIAAPSHWIASLARESRLFRNRRIEVIPTGVDVHTFYPRGKAALRAQRGIPQEEKIVLFTSIAPDADERKGFKELLSALDILHRSPENMAVTPLVVGNVSEAAKRLLPPNTIYAGYIADDTVLAETYCMADAVIIPSLEDNLPNVALESAACGLPLIAFNVGGLPDIVIHRHNGFLAAQLSGEMLANGVRWVLQQESQGLPFNEHSRCLAVEKFSLEAQANHYISLYQSLYDCERK